MTWETQTETGPDGERSPALVSLRESEKGGIRRERRGEVGCLWAECLHLSWMHCS